MLCVRILRWSKEHSQVQTGDGKHKPTSKVPQLGGPKTQKRKQVNETEQRQAKIQDEEHRCSFLSFPVSIRRFANAGMMPGFELLWRMQVAAHPQPLSPVGHEMAPGQECPGVLPGGALSWLVAGHLLLPAP
ncbi:hypothetical protein B0H65DRAFT_437626 [Neurospora tetraspora]|uniref:Uncharacterized protein n=1 Tax=Neurospora tetraspora TaxID=94610 RepID=A0AAE0MV92_9PEZI|nr:hypothetical protein B0H65DRAFT_437626 [Neurospora tetraspora]